MEKEELWHTVLAKLELDISRPNFLTWFQETGIMHLEDGVATISVPNIFVKEWLQNKYHKVILHTLRAITPDVKDLVYNIGKLDDAAGFPFIRHHGAPRKKMFSPQFIEDALAIKDLAVNPITNLNPRYTFDSFIVGSFNELAHAAAQSVIKNPGLAYNPFFIYGGVGLGKTHLMQAVGNEILRYSPSAKIRYVPSERYMGEIVEALKTQQMNKLKDKYREVDLLVVDDIQFIARTEKMQEEFFHTFNTLYERNKQIIISSDRPPHAISTLEERLRSRFEGGMIADIGLPDFETRLLILKTKIDVKKADVPEEVLRYLAEKIKNNIRELEGALNRVIIESKVSNAPITVDTAKKSVLSHLAAPKKFISAKKIIKAVAEFYDMDERELLRRSRKKDVVRPRQIAMYLMREELKSSYPSIGDKFGGRDHTTAIHSCEKVAKDLLANPEFEEEIRAIRDKVFAK
ncbi:MAG: chromosomal replication initiator protein [Parcubacteria group bacterium Gr01-1014_33]|nr:MAG: chromosomal replication initiator protein [Parcubacteria group bacterium Gr01-1014_33]